ncbi:MAG: Rpn family recombination-promoting nuclease/putative transposase [Planctomycetaceae bacterium]|jgi:predicted transposase/invertase (TIGR01784 family)|nr:Rpn family recombination-promoting nuclease/putative transposase [Planctomycetaceae bacterium]
MTEKEPLIIKPTSDIFIVSFLSAPKNEPALCSIINAVLKDNSGHELIETAQVLHPFNIAEHVLDKRIALDVRVKDRRKRIFNIEIQIYPHNAFRERILYGWADSYSSQLITGENYNNLNVVITIVITEFDICPQSNQIHLIFELRERNRHDLLFSNHLQIHAWQLQKLIQGHSEVLESVAPDLANWSQFFAFGDKKSEAEMSTLTNDDPQILEAYREFQLFTADPQARELARRRRLFLVDQYLSLNASRTEGRAEGKAEGVRNSVLAVLRKKFTNVPQEIEMAIQQMNDPIALESLVIEAASCQTLDEFATALR